VYLGLHYHLTEDQVLELLQAFGKVKAFHLVKNEPDSLTSKGYCFVEYSDPNVTPVAVMGLNGMDLGGGKVLTARVAGERSAAQMISGMMIGAPPTAASATGSADAGGLKPDAIIVDGYDIDTLVDAAVGLKPMPTAPMHFDQFGTPITRTPAIPIIVPPVLPSVAIPGVLNPVPAVLPTSVAPIPSALDIANAALDAAFGPGASAVAAGIPPTAAPPPPFRSRVLVLHNMVTDEDLQTDEDYDGLKEEVAEEVAKFGKLISMEIPRKASGLIEPSAIRKIFLEYATVQDSANAERELAGRQFGPNVVEASYFDEAEYTAGRLR
jgi:splicing factor U2AF subunit